MIFCITEILKGGKMLLAVKKRYTLTIPKNIRERLHVQEGEYVDAEIQGDSLVLTPVKIIRKGQEYFWTKEWQEKEREADEDIKTGRLSRAYGENELDAFFKDLKKEAKKIAPKKN
jgi:AbrB family looped-hinge helix DNA binding protein